MKADDGRLSIGAVLARLQPDFPDLSISKIRFLEAEGLVTPQRTPSGYRTFDAADVERLRYILTAQRDRFWPLKVIREALDALDRGLQPPGEGGEEGRPQVPAPTDLDGASSPAALRSGRALRLTAAELREACGLDRDAFEAMVTYGLVHADPGGHYGEPDLAVARAAGALAAYGIEPRHLRPFRTAADREIGLVQQAVRPRQGRSDVGRADARGSADSADQTDPTDPTDPTVEILAHCVALHTALVKAGLSRG